MPQWGIGQCYEAGVQQRDCDNERGRRCFIRGHVVAHNMSVAPSFSIRLLTLFSDAYIIVSNYVDQLDDEMSVKETTQMIKAISQPAPVTTYTSFGGGGYVTPQVGQSHGMRGGNMV